MIEIKIAFKSSLSELPLSHLEQSARLARVTPHSRYCASLLSSLLSPLLSHLFPYRWSLVRRLAQLLLAVLTSTISHNTILYHLLKPSISCLLEVTNFDSLCSCGRSIGSLSSLERLLLEDPAISTVRCNPPLLCHYV